MESTIIENFPEDLLLEILLRLPVKSLIRFKCVSKSWFCFVSDPSFAKLHFQLTAPNNHQLLLKLSPNGFNEAQICSIDLDGSLHEHIANFISPIPSSLHVDHIRILGVCRGFILLAYYSLDSIWNPPPYLLLWNPSTGVHKTLPLSLIASNFRPRYKLEQVSFEYSASEDDYFVIIAWIEDHYDGTLFHLNCFEFFSVRINTWINTPIHLTSRKQFDFTSFGGNFHWLSIDDTAIVAYDLKKRTSSLIPLPFDAFFLDSDLLSLRLEVFKGRLCLLCCSGRQSGFAELWMMKEYKVRSSWIKVDYAPTYAIPHHRFRPIYFTDGATVGLDDSYIVKVYSKRQLLCCYYHPSCFHQKYYIYAESLLSLPSDGAQAWEDDQ